MSEQGPRFPLWTFSQKLASPVHHLYLQGAGAFQHRVLWNWLQHLSHVLPHMLTAQTWYARMRHCGFIGQQARAASNGAILSDDGESCWRGEPWFTGSSGSVMRSNSALTPPPLLPAPHLTTHPFWWAVSEKQRDGQCFFTMSSAGKENLTLVLLTTGFSMYLH